MRHYVCRYFYYKIFVVPILVNMATAIQLPAVIDVAAIVDLLDQIANTKVTKTAFRNANNIS